MPGSREPVRDEGHGLSTDRYKVSYSSDPLLSATDGLPGGQYAVPVDGNGLLCGGSGGNALPTHANAVSDGGDGLFDDGCWPTHGLPRGFDEVSVGRDRLPTHADEMPTAVDQLRESHDGLPLVNSRYALHSTAESHDDRGNVLERRERAFA
jgi:hypothetical protein